MKNIAGFLKKDAVLTCAWILAIVSAFFVRPDLEYLNYPDWETLGLLFCLMAVMAGLQAAGLFRRIGEKLLSLVHTTRGLESVLIFLCFFFSMFITNDVALITFVPFAIGILHLAKLSERILPVVVLQTIAANLGSMFSPIGNPQNLYLYSKSGTAVFDFFQIMFPYAALSFVGIVVFLLFRKSIPIPPPSSLSEGFLPRRSLILYLILFCLCLLSVAHILPVLPLFLLTTASVALFDRFTLLRVDYSLLLTFLGFFVFIGNMGRIPEFQHFLAEIITGREVITSVLASQIISNVPAALLLSGFTQDWNSLFIGTNLGGLGTLIASMASLISYKQIIHHHPESKGKYLFLFTIVNLIFLAGLLLEYFILLYVGI